MELVEFLQARITEDLAMVPVDRASEDCGTGFNLDSVTVEVGLPRWLAECEAKKQIIELATDASGLDMSVDLERGVGTRDETEPYLGDLILRSLAAPYAGHPDYREEWRP